MKIENKKRVYELCNMITNIQDIIGQHGAERLLIGKECPFASGLMSEVECDFEEIKPILQAKLNACSKELETL